MKKQLARQQAVAAVVKSTLGLDRGIAASPNDAARVEASVRSLEAAAPCTLAGPALTEALAGPSWRLVYASALVPGSGRPTDGTSGALDLRSLSTVLATASPVSLGAVSLALSAERLDDVVSLALPLPWPLPELEVEASFEHALGATGAPGGLSVRLDSVGLSRADRRADLPVPRELIESALGSIPLTQGLTCIAAVLDGPTRLSVLRTERGDVRVYAMEGPAPPAAAATAEGGAAGRMADARATATQAPATQRSADAPTKGEEGFEEEFWVDDGTSGGYTSGVSAPEWGI